MPSMDKISAQQRSIVMARVRSKDTQPEIAIRKLLSSLGFHYRIHSKTLPCSPDISNKKRKKAIFIHGCFWHRHPGCKRASFPTTNVEYWEKKFARNVERDRRCLNAYREMGWTVLVIWECELRQKEQMVKKLRDYLAKPC